MSISPYTYLSSISDDASYDVAVMGTGAAGMAAALFAALKGAKVLLIESTEYVGGTTALSGGTTWVPLTRYAKDTSTEDSFEKVANFLDLSVGDHAPKAMREAFLKAGPEAIHTLVDNTDVGFRACAYHPDYLADLPNATTNSRALEPLPYTTRHLGKHLKLLRPPIPEFTVLGGMMINREDIGHLLNRFQSPKSFLYTVKLVMRYAYDRVFHGSTARSVMGHALIARMLSSVIKLGVHLSVNTDTLSLDHHEDGSSTLVLKQGNSRKRVLIKGGVILASGGFGRDAKKRKAFYPDGTPDYSPAAPGHFGAMHSLVETLGAYYGDKEDQAAFWAPVSLRKRPDGSTAVFPHFVFDRSKPGTVCVDQQGKRFVNESESYHRFGKSMLEQNTTANPCYIVTDAKAITKYGLGIVRLGGDDLRPYLKDGYLIEGKSVTELAQKLGVDAQNLADSIEQINRAAITGVDEQFNRGSTLYQRANGDPEHKPNPTIGAITTAPFYAVRLYPADIGTAKGLMADPNAQLIRADGSSIQGLYACGNDLNSIMGGTYPGPGITIGPGIVFGYLAANHATQRAQQKI